jgi:hypothetical protein
VENLKKVLCDIYHSGMWKYYEDVDFNNPFLDVKYKEFAEEYIKYAQKSEHNPLFEHLQHAYSEEHVVIVFFLGIMMYEKNDKIKKAIDAVIGKYQSEISDIDIGFPFLWFLISLFHDSGYFFEEKGDYDSVDDFQEKEMVLNKLKKPCGVPICLSDSYDKYYLYKRKCIGKPDHGILAGVLLYDSLVKTYHEISESSYAEKISAGLYRYNGLYWSEKVLDIYNYCSWVVLAHNIFFCDKKVNPALVGIYKSNGLKNLVIDKPVVGLNEYPFLYLLYLVDTIEMSKRGVKSEDCLLGFNDDDDILISYDNIKDDYEKYYKDMPSWMKIKVAYDENNNVVSISLIG